MCFFQILFQSLVTVFSLMALAISPTSEYNYWASEANPTLGCSIEISRDIYMSVCRMSVVCQINCVGGITYGPRACSKSFFGG